MNTPVRQSIILEHTASVVLVSGLVFTARAMLALQELY